ncbi:MAG TPA: NAD(P)/FAD-dependent oxidoreductase [Bryobacteraceae bacterium]|nr:NAD(P)/FAD-dependent oxidoreductase [Bryobacteraceae bacterium]
MATLARLGGYSFESELAIAVSCFLRHSSVQSHTIIAGAGPAGLAAALELTQHGRSVTLLEAGDMVGGLARTVEYKGYLYDIGGHRFYTKVAPVARMWRDLLGSDLLVRPRLSRIYYDGTFFKYPLEIVNAVSGLGILESFRCGVSFVNSHLFRTTPELDFETYMINRFGRRLYEKFFRTYTEKVWGMSCRTIRADWAAQRIAGLTVGALLAAAIPFPKSSKRKTVTTLIHQFEYPRRGPGMMWSRAQQVIEERGSEIKLDKAIDRVEWREGAVTSFVADGRAHRADHFISSLPLRTLIQIMTPQPPASVRTAAARLSYRDFITVLLIVKKRDLFPDNWIYVHDPGVRVGRIQNYKNWSPEMVPDASMTSLGMEYFCFDGDELWSMSDEAIKALAAREIEALRLARSADVVDATVLRVPKAYPVYDETYAESVAVIRDFLATLPNLQAIGRNGMHRYNNQDHSMLTGMLAARNILGARYDLWNINMDGEYLESGSIVTELELRELEASQPAVPRRI